MFLSFSLRAAIGIVPSVCFRASLALTWVLPRLVLSLFALGLDICPVDLTMIACQDLWTPWHSWGSRFGLWIDGIDWNWNKIYVYVKVCACSVYFFYYSVNEWVPSVNMNSGGAWQLLQRSDQRSNHGWILRWPHQPPFWCWNISDEPCGQPWDHNWSLGWFPLSGQISCEIHCDFFGDSLWPGRFESRPEAWNEWWTNSPTQAFHEHLRF